MGCTSLIGLKDVRLAEVLKPITLVNRIVPKIRRVTEIKLEKVTPREHTGGCQSNRHFKIQLRKEPFSDVRSNRDADEE